MHVYVYACHSGTSAMYAPYMTVHEECLYSSPNNSLPLSISLALCFSSVSFRKYNRMNFSRSLSMFAT